MSIDVKILTCSPSFSTKIVKSNRKFKESDIFLNSVPVRNQTESQYQDYDYIDDVDEQQSMAKNISTSSKPIEVIFQSSKKAVSEKLKDHLSTINISDLTAIGSGNFKKVYKTSVVINDKSKKFAIAVPNKKLDTKLKNAWMQERNNIKDIGEANIIGALPFYGLLKDGDDDQEYIISKLCKGALNTLVQELDQKHLLMTLQQAWNALINLHKAGFVHRDVKASNYLCKYSNDNELKVYLSDFGLLTKSEKFSKGMGVNFSILDPATYKKLKEARLSTDLNVDYSFMADPKSDTWAFGMMICQLLRNADPNSAFDCDNSNQIEAIFKNWVTEGLKMDPVKSQATISEFIDNTPFKNQVGLKQLVRAMMAYEPAERPSDESIGNTLKNLALDA